MTARDFSNADHARKKGRIELPENPADLPPEGLKELERAVLAAVKDGYIACPAAWKVAADRNVPKIAVGAMMDKLGLRFTDCQLGCFKVDKTPYDGGERPGIPDAVAERIEALQQSGGLTCANVFALARELGVKPLTAADAANVRGYKIRQCQLGCF
jgi:hypothetical protein